MYIKRNKKYFSYIFVADAISVIFSFLLSYFFKFNNLNMENKYISFLLFILATGVVVDAATENLAGFFTRGYYQESISTIKWWVYVLLVAFMYLFATKETSYYSREFFLVFIISGVLLIYISRIFFKRIVMKKYKVGNSGTKVVVITTSDRLCEIIKNLKKQKMRDYWVSGIVLVDVDRTGEEVDGFKICASAETMYDALKNEILDEIFVRIGEENERLLKEITYNFQLMGVTVHISLDSVGFPLANIRAESFAGYHVITTSNNMISHTKLLQKRMLDLCGSVVGLIITALISLFVIPAICIESRGAPLYSQMRVGRNGRKFKMYKFRSMYKDADARKAALMEQNKMSGLMFKIDNDPRITKVGAFIRTTSIDELPQFWNVFKGEMSLVGTRPPTIDEYEQYSLHHKSRLSFKPGITGFWQVSGRSNVTDFEQIVEMDNEYISKWSIGLDLHILFATVFKVLKGDGAE